MVVPPKHLKMIIFSRKSQMVHVTMKSLDISLDEHLNTCHVRCTMAQNQAAVKPVST